MHENAHPQSCLRCHCLVVTSIPFPLHSWTAPNLTYQLLTAAVHSIWTQWFSDCSPIIPLTHSLTFSTNLGCFLHIGMNQTENVALLFLCSSAVAAFVSVWMPMWSQLRRCLAKTAVCWDVTKQRLLYRCLFHVNFPAVGIHVAICKYT
jgi:hypothetical protein